MKLFLPSSVTENVVGQKWNLRPLRFKRKNLQAFMYYFGDNEDAFDNLVKIFNTKYN